MSDVKIALLLDKTLCFLLCTVPKPSLSAPVVCKFYGFKTIHFKMKNSLSVAKFLLPLSNGSGTTQIHISCFKYFLLSLLLHGSSTLGTMFQMIASPDMCAWLSLFDNWKTKKMRGCYFACLLPESVWRKELSYQDVVWNLSTVKHIECFLIECR